ncbi:hypothetical protein FOL47_003703 [Perkinsus chesapeaki]|uniref:Uncharacterized protein n=1 Tax=Perkinsus chesapeaki TaxID=330153 RepID=A0A7J6M6Q0_PERCH|nr:hypothetical protein FOL47_003703 [Perkinsus chesapeaki]
MPSPLETWQFRTGYDGTLCDVTFDGKTEKWQYGDTKLYSPFKLDLEKAVERHNNVVKELRDRLSKSKVDVSEAVAFRDDCRAQKWTGPTSGKAPGHVQANLVILPSHYKDDFQSFCSLNPQACPLLETIDSTVDGQHHLRLRLVSTVVAPGADILTDLPKYVIHYNGESKEVLSAAAAADQSLPENVAATGLTGFIFGCSFSWEDKLAQAGVPPRHMVEGKNVAMYRTNIPNKVAGPFGGVLVVSMRPYKLNQISRVIEVTSKYPLAHGRPMHIGDGRMIGVDVTKPPDYGDRITLEKDDIYVFWCCGVTSATGALSAHPELLITHSPGHMLVLDITNDMLNGVGDFDNLISF